MKQNTSASTRGHEMTRKMQVYLNEFNVLMDKAVYLPFVSGLLQASAQRIPAIATAYEFMPYLFIRSEPEAILRQIENPSVAAFSVFMWNEQLCLQVARELKQRHPECLIVFGGQQVPYTAIEYLSLYPFIDIAVHGEGEESFQETLQQFIVSDDFSSVRGITWRNKATGVISQTTDRDSIAQLDQIPSPYLEGLFDQLIAENPDLSFQAIIQSNRGCPFSCAYCSWHKNSSLRYFDLQRINAELDWCGKNSISYVFSADSNFGIHRRDLEIARHLVETKKRFGSPEKFRTCFTKNADERIFELSMLLLNNGLEKGITLSFQSLNETVLKNVRRENIKLSTYRSLLARFNAMHVPIYTELILGLPGETEESWKEGIESILQAGLQGQLFIYPCEVYPNTLMAEPAYRKEFGIVTKRIKLTEIHGAIRPESSVAEYQELLVSTNSMPLVTWRKMLIFSWAIMLLYSMKVGFFVLRYLKNRFDVNYTDFVDYVIINADGVIRQELSLFESQATAIAEGEGRGVILPEYGDIYWDTEEASFLRLSNHMVEFYQELAKLAQGFLDNHDIEYDSEELAEVFAYQSLRTPQCSLPAPEPVHFTYNIPEYCEDKAVSISRAPIILDVTAVDFTGDYKRFAREIILWGRKSNRLLNDVSWSRL